MQSDVLRKTLLVAVVAGLFISLAGLSDARAQREVTGTVVDESGSPLPGVNVLLQGTRVGTQTDGDGNYQIDIPENPPGPESSVLVFSFVGFDDQEVNIRGRSVVDVTLDESVAELEEVVVSGYRVSPKTEATGASSYVGGDEIENLSVQSADQALQGRAAGVRVTANTGAPGGAIEVDIRGTGSINAGDDPLYIIDGVQVNTDSDAATASSNPLAAINPEDIESINVLKDVAASSIYGAQAANGVVVITTKTGSAGATQINFSSQLGAVQKIKTLDVLSAQQYSEIRVEAFLNLRGLSGRDRRPANGRDDNIDTAMERFGNPGVPNGNRVNTDWQDALYRRGLTQSYNLSASGGNESTNFYISGGYRNQEGQILASKFQNGTLRANLGHQINEKLSLESKVNLSTTRLDGTLENDAGTYIPQFAAALNRPDRRIYNEDGTFNQDFSGDTFSRNPIQQEKLSDKTNSTTQIIGNIAANYEIIPGLISRTYAGVGHKDLQEDLYDDPRIAVYAGNENGLAVTYSRRETNFNVSQTFTYTKSFSDKHDLSAVGGTEYKQEQEQFASASGNQFPNRLFRTLQSAAEPESVTAFETKFRQLSFFGNAEYIYDDRYVANATLRYDGNSRFGANQRFGLFYSGSAAWRIANEAFMGDAEFLDRLTLRASYGITGNSQISNFASRNLFGTGGIGNYAGLDGINVLRPGVGFIQLGNADLTWEENQQVNIGLDYTLFGGRLAGAFNVYQERSNELLLARPLPLDSGFGSISDNIGTLENRGLEVELNTINLDVGGFRWDTDFNITFPKNEVLELVDGQTIRGKECITTSICVGEPLGQTYIQKYAGVNPADGRAFWRDENGNLTYAPTGDDNRVVGNSQPDYYGGLGNTFSYGGVTLDVFFQYDYGREIFNNDLLFLDQAGSVNENQFDIVLERWQEPGDIAPIPRPINGSNAAGSEPPAFSTRYFEDASYIRLKQLRLGYSLPTSLLGGTGLRNATVYVQGENLLTFTEYRGLDPEIVGNVNLGDYPQSKRFTAGVRVGL